MPGETLAAGDKTENVVGMIVYQDNLIELYMS